MITDKAEKEEVPQIDVKGWVMATLTLLFVSLYASALFGWLRPLADVTMITRLEPIIFVIIGYYFGRLPAQANEKTLKEEIYRHSKRSDAAQHVKETAEKEREVMDEKIKNAKIALIAVRGEYFREGSPSSVQEGEEVVNSIGKNRKEIQPIETVFSILNS